MSHIVVDEEVKDKRVVLLQNEKNGTSEWRFGKARGMRNRGNQSKYQNVTDCNIAQSKKRQEEANIKREKGEREMRKIQQK